MPLVDALLANHQPAPSVAWCGECDLWCKCRGETAATLEAIVAPIEAYAAHKHNDLENRFIARRLSAGGAEARSQVLKREAKRREQARVRAREYRARLRARHALFGVSDVLPVKRKTRVMGPHFHKANQLVAGRQKSPERDVLPLEMETV